MSDHKNSLESWVVGQFIDQEIDTRARRTRGSGCGNEVGDIANSYCYVECKMKHTKENIIVDFKEEWKHLLFRIPMYTTKFPVMFVEQMYGEKFAILKADDFFTLLKEAKQ
jgi:hypothetical protein